MKALLMKDTLVLWKQMKLFLLIILVLSAIPNSFNNVFAVIYAAMLPYTAMAYDERSRWEQLAAMMPFSPRELVTSKYVFGWLCIAAAAALSALIQGFLSMVLPLGSYAFSLPLVFLALCGAVCVLSITLPLMFRFGVEKGRMVMFLIIFLVCGSSGALASIAVDGSESAGFVCSGAVLAGAACLAVLMSAVSLPLSKRLYARERG